MKSVLYYIVVVAIFAAAFAIIGEPAFFSVLDCAHQGTVIDKNITADKDGNPFHNIAIQSNDDQVIVTERNVQAYYHHQINDTVTVCISTGRFTGVKRHWVEWSTP